MYEMMICVEYSQIEILARFCVMRENIRWYFSIDTDTIRNMNPLHIIFILALSISFFSFIRMWLRYMNSFFLIWILGSNKSHSLTALRMRYHCWDHMGLLCCWYWLTQLLNVICGLKFDDVRAFAYAITIFIIDNDGWKLVTSRLLLLSIFRFHCLKIHKCACSNPERKTISIEVVEKYDSLRLWLLFCGIFIQDSSTDHF